MGDACGVTWHD